MTLSVETMISKAYKALDLAYAPYSNYQVASCLSSENDNLYLGVNIENGAYGLTVCAEACAICNMVSSGERAIKSMVILSKDNALCPPCGACRQRIFEFSTPKTQIYLCNKDKIFHTLTVNELLPFTFDFKNHNQTP